MEQYLRPCGLIDSNHPSVIKQSKELTQTSPSEVEKAVSIYKFVRDNILFGFSPEFDNLPASKVLSDGVGFCNPKSTLFTALLRAAGIPARQHMVSINMNVLKGLGPPTNVYGDHAITEVWLNGSWVKVDSYTVDSALFTAGQAKLAEEGGTMGFGVHKDGRNSWDGASDSFVQYIMPEGTGIHVAAMIDASNGTPAGSGIANSSQTDEHSSRASKDGGAVAGMAGPDVSFSGAAAAPDGPMSDRDFGAVLGWADLSSVYFPLVASSSPFAWQRRWWGRQVFRLLACYCNARVGAARAGKL